MSDAHKAHPYAVYEGVVDRFSPTSRIMQRCSLRCDDIHQTGRDSSRRRPNETLGLEGGGENRRGHPHLPLMNGIETR